MIDFTTMGYFMEPLVTIITANYNNAKFLPDVLSSVEKQTYKNIEHVIVDDKSTDNSPEILKNYLSKNKNVVLFLNNEKSLSVSILRNQAVKASNGKYILNLDSDDILFENAVEILVRKAEEEKLDLCYGTMTYIDDEGNPYRPSVSVGSEYKPGRLIKNVFLSPPRLFTREIYEKAEGYNEKLTVAEDWDYYLRIEENSSNIAWSGSGPLFYYRVHNKSLSRKTDKLFYEIKRKHVKADALKRRSSKRILFIAESNDVKYLNELRISGNDVCSLSLLGIENKELEQFVTDIPYKNKLIYKIRIWNTIKKLKLIKKEIPHEVVIMGKIPIWLEITVKILFTKNIRKIKDLKAMEK